MISPSELKVGMSIKYEGRIFTVLDVWHTKPGKGVAYFGARLKELSTGKIIEKLFRPQDKLEKAHIKRVSAKYLYRMEETLHFMDNETFEEFHIPLSLCEELPLLLPEGEDATLLLCGEEVVDVEFPSYVVLEVVHTEPGIRGDTVGAATKPARLNTGLVVQVPLFVQIGDKIKLDTRTKEYIERVI